MYNTSSYKAQIIWFGFYLTYCQDYSKKVWAEYAKCRAPLLGEPAGSDELLRLNCATPLIEWGTQGEEVAFDRTSLVQEKFFFWQSSVRRKVFWRVGLLREWQWPRQGLRGGVLQDSRIFVKQTNIAFTQKRQKIWPMVQRCRGIIRTQSKLAQQTARNQGVLIALRDIVAR